MIGKSTVFPFAAASRPGPSQQVAYSCGMSFRPATRHVPMSVQIGDQVRKRITSGEWAVGTKLPGEHDLVAAFGASRATVREALRGLIHAGLLEARPGDGTYVRSASELDAVLRRQISPRAVDSVFEVREALEIYAARLAAARATDDELGELAVLLADRDAATDLKGRLERDIRFHDALVAASGNPLLLDMYRGVDRASTYSPGELSERARRRFLVGEWEDEDEHHALLSALRQRDPDAAADAATRLLQHAREAFVRAEDGGTGDG
ncbi:FCD domain-containing protein [Saccharopolyspora gregorii]|uniref:FCD domain-containing protein n=2 Tax=Saccharopolyspora gregorii TaxID=33914 RepID=A0ABP6RN81_9PSEU